MPKMSLIKFKRSEHKDPETELVARLLDRVESEGTISSPGSSIWTKPVMVNGFLCQVEKFEGGWQGIAYKKVGDKDINIDKLPQCPTREDAERMLYTIARAY